MTGPGHAGDGELLRYSDGELTPAEARQVRAHLDSCWQCRAELGEIEGAIRRCVRYRKDDLPERMPVPPAPWMDIRVRMAELDQVLAGRPWHARIWEEASAAFVRQRAWAGAVAVALVAALLVNQLRNAPAVQAAELLDRAIRAQETRIAGVEVKPRRIEIRTGSRRSVRTVGAGAKAASDGSLAAVEPLFARARYDWNDPLSASSYAHWRDALPEKRDEVTAVRDAAAPGREWYRVRTTTNANFLHSATLQLTAEDLRPVEAAFEFVSQDRVEISDLGPADSLTGIRPAESPPAVSPAVVSPIETARVAEIERPATPGEELAVWVALHRMGADLGEPIAVSREGGRVVVRGFGLNAAVGQRIASELAGNDRAVFETANAGADPAVADLRRGMAVQSASAARQGAQWQSEIEAKLGGRAEYDEFVDRLLSSEDRLMLRVHAVRRLAERFGPAEVAGLSPTDRGVLESMLREHGRAAEAEAAAIEERSRPVLQALGAHAAAIPALSAANWQESAGEMLTEARRAESLVAAMLGGVTAGSVDGPVEELPTRLLSATAALRLRASEFLRATIP
ncbi:MAG: anti-sigma factor [Bryobacteraceae bacterium]